MRILPGLLQRTRRARRLSIHEKRHPKPVHGLDTLEPPVLHLDYQQAAPGMQKMTMPSSPSVLIGDPGFVLIVFEMGLQPPREAAFARGHLAYYARKDGDEVRHARCGDLAGIRI